MSTLIQLATKLRTECGVSGTQTTVTGATGEWKRLIDWIIDSWSEIQAERQEWEWMRKTVTFNTVVNQGEYTPTDAAATDVSSWKKKSFRAYHTASGVGTEQRLTQVDYTRFRNVYLLGTARTTYTRPSVITFAPNKNIILGYAPNDIYTITGEYYKKPIVLANDADTPDMPEQFHNLIVYLAMTKYGTYESAPEVYDGGLSKYGVMFSKLCLDQLPGMEP